jgi:hypothetical protein
VNLVADGDISAAGCRHAGLYQGARRDTGRRRLLLLLLLGPGARQGAACQHAPARRLPGVHQSALPWVHPSALPSPEEPADAW